MYDVSPDLITEDRLVTPVKIKLPMNLSGNEESAVIDILMKWKHNRFKVQSKGIISPNTVIDLIHVVNGMSLQKVCLEATEKRWYIDDIDKKKMDCECKNVNLTIAGIKNVTKGFICCVLESQLQQFAHRMAELTDYGEASASENRYVPDMLEICIAMHKEEDGTKIWYRAQYQQPLDNEQAQVGLIDFDDSIVVKMSDIRKLTDRFAYDRLSFIGKIRCPNAGLDILDYDFFPMLGNITAELVKPVADSFELYFGNEYFINDEDFFDL